jgi:hypothetical protein
MKLQTLVSTPQLQKITIDDEAIVEKYGEEIDFYIYDRQDMDTYMSLATLGEDTSISAVSKVVSKIILTEDGNRILEDNQQLPMDMMLKVVEETVKHLGNSMTQTSNK